MPNEYVVSSLEGGIGQIVLNRPAAHNALDTAMVKSIHGTLNGWDTDLLEAVVIRAETSKAFCAGGDIKTIRQLSIEGEIEKIEDFFSAEYAMNECIASYPKPVVSLINGLCMGGGMGLSIHGNFRVVSEQATMAMPETAIGFFPDVGASYFLPRLPGAIGMYLGLTGHQMDYRDALYCGLATHYVPAGIIDTVPALLAERPGTPVGTVLAGLTGTPQEPGGHLADHRAEIDWCFGATTLSAIQGRLRADDTPWSGSLLQKMASLSPQSLELTVSLLRWGSQRSLAECLQTELRMTRIVTASPDFIEGVRAVLVDKDRHPAWTRATAQSWDHLLEPMQA